MSYKLNYWNVPGRGESIRLMLAIGGFQFENNFIPLPLPIPNPPYLSPAPFDDGTWSKMKGSTPWGSVPTLTLPDGESFGQQRAIVRYLGKLIQREGHPLYPTDAREALLVDSFMDALEDIWPIIVGLNGPDSMETAPLYNTMLGKPYLMDFLNEGMKRGAGNLAFLFDNLEKNLSTGPYVLGDIPSCADVLIFAAFAWWGAGMFPGLDLIVDGRPKLQTLIKNVATWPEVKNYYESLRQSREEMPRVGEIDYKNYYKVYHELCELA